MKKLLAVLLSLVVLVTPLAIAEDVEPELTNGEVEEITETVEVDEEVEAGVTPENDFLWGLERAQEKISLLLTLKKEKKVAKRLKFAKERLEEVKAMAESEEASLEDVAELDEEAAEEGEEVSEEVKELKEKINNHVQVLERVKAKLEEKGVPTHGIENALFRATVMKEARVQFRECVSEARVLEDSEAKKEAVRNCFQEGKEIKKANKEQLRERVQEIKEFRIQKIEELRERVPKEEAETEEVIEEETEEETETEEAQAVEE